MARPREMPREDRARPIRPPSRRPRQRKRLGRRHHQMRLMHAGESKAQESAAIIHRAQPAIEESDMSKYMPQV